MAIIKFGAIVTDMRGKLGGHVFQKGNQSRIIKTNSIPRRTLSQFNSASQFIVDTVIANYSALSFANKEKWSNAAKQFTFQNVFNDPVQYTGRQLFIFLNNNLELSGQSQITVPDNLNPVVSAPEYSACSFDTAGETGTVVGGVAPANHRYVFRMLQVSAGTISPNQKKSLFNANTSSSNFTQPIIYDPYVARYGTPLTTTNAFVWAYLVNSTGFKSFSILQKVVIT